jgi:uncharacterized integral membrane protein (TIGR00698 family)
MYGIKKYGLGFGIVLVIAGLAYVLGRWVPIVGGPAFGLLIGIIVNFFWGITEKAKPGIVFCSKKLLQWAIILLGCGLHLTQVWKTGTESLLVMILTMAAAFLSAYALGRAMRTPGNLNSLIAVGTGICGGSAIAAVSPIIRAKNDEIAYGISIVFLLNLAAVLTFPAIGRWLGLSDAGFGLWAGTAIHDTSSVVAAGYIFSDEAGAYATIVKLTRTTFIIPIVFAFAYIMNRRSKQESAQYSLKKIFPWFIVWFVMASLLNTLGLLPEQVTTAAGFLAKFMITMALTAIGLGTNIRAVLNTGPKPLILGLAVWLTVTATSLIVQRFAGLW